MPSFLRIFDGRGSDSRPAPPPAPLLPSFGQRLLGSRGSDYMKEVQKIRRETRNDYQQQKKAERKNRRIVLEKAEESLPRQRRKFYKNTDISLLESQLEKAQKKGSEKATERAQQRLEYRQKKTDKKWALKEWHQNEDRRLQWQSEDHQRKLGLKEERGKRIIDLRERSLNDNRAA